MYSSLPAVRYDAILNEVATKYYPNRGLTWALQNTRAQFIGQLAEVVLERQYPDLHIDKLSNHEYSDVWSRCSSGPACLNGQAAYQVKVHQDGDPAKYFRDFQNERYRNDRGFIIPKEHRAAVRQYAREHSRPDLASKITDKYDLSNRKLNEIADSGTRRRTHATPMTGSGYLWVSAGIQIAMIAVFAAQTCTDGVSARDCTRSLVGLGASMLLSNLAARGLTSALVNQAGIGQQWAGRIAGLAIGAVYEIYFAYSMYGLSKDFFIATTIGLSAVAVGMTAGQACTGATIAALGPFSLVAGAVCGAGGYLVTKLLGTWIWRELTDSVVDAMDRRIEETEAAIVDREKRLTVGATL